MASIQEVVIVGAKRTPLGSLQGSLSALSAPQLGTAAIKGALADANVAADAVEEVFMGHVLSGGCGQNPARQAALGAGIPHSVPCTGVQKVCASGMKATSLAYMTIAMGAAQVVVAGGMESMSNAPYMLPGARGGMRYGHGQVLDSCQLDGLTDAYSHEVMGIAAELCAKEHGVTRDAQDDYALASYERARASAGVLAAEICPVDVTVRGKTTTVSEDEEPGKLRADKFRSLRTVFQKDAGTVTAGNASNINDGAAALVLTSRAYAEANGLRILAIVRGAADAAQDPERFTTAPALAAPKALAAAGVASEDVDLWELNEAFSVVAVANCALLKIPTDRVNVLGGAVALGHPLGCSGARIIVTLLTALAHHGKHVGCAAICNGGGGASAIVIERPKK